MTLCDGNNRIMICRLNNAKLPIFSSRPRKKRKIHFDDALAFHPTGYM